MELTKEWVAKKLPTRPKNAHKGTFGKVLVIAGSENYPGAPYLACVACYRVGAGLVTLATEQTVKIIVSRKLPEVTFLPPHEVVGKINEYDVVLIGPGLGQSDQTVKLVKDLLNSNLPPTVIDGDGLNILSKVGEWWRSLKGEVVVTPHSGEMARLTGLTIKEIQSDRIDVAQYFAKKWEKVLVLKGTNTVIVSPSGEVLLSPFANPALATAGTGDVLAGAIAGMLAQGLKPFDATAVGVYIHGLAGEILRKKIGNAGVLASDVLPLLPKAIKLLKVI
ncbi:NAD(P)H-hydrate dehydratase [Candidatus Daviesbacteria bacterium RIFCSPHIGHO2_01_FULL_40_11]|uniref:ADP-dependent (S)-NAD(P)H-hydrate dehydratase n=1 Tax=Candidatus Daviesbacteria bacterium RIFCSPHIGHO2_01_FULL_40_11 TaxID=1797762 RepID=A0A1F5JHQ6_9BACT|nr:MAG: NAD(P)H-hydrate dehydratase [Candidatus Daviesbacteria bacterium RIFCSPHIGHO2_01_FULL_40_11]OGE63096.1 MAG: NAD(P)H-hydrate dehydratase [Candidatus Daviesbacteria bacterium RIFCSPLOWO2_01_FULL_40_27]